MATASRSRSRYSGRHQPNPEITLNYKQERFVDSKAKVRLFRGAIASGKTIAGAAESIRRRYDYPGTGQLVGGPSWDQVRDGAMVTLRRLLHPDWIVYENKNEHIWELPNGSWFQFRSLSDPEVIRGIEWHDFWIDEIAQCSQKALDIALGRIRLPYDNPDFVHSGWGTTSPRGMDWTLDVFGWEGKKSVYNMTDADGRPLYDEKGKRRTVEIEYDVTHATIFDNRMNLPAGYIEQLQERYEGSPFYEQELLGMYTAFEGLVYVHFRREKHVMGDPCELSECRRVVVGIDFGGITPTALELLGERASGRSHVYAELYKTGATLPDIIAKLWEWTELRGRKPDVVACDGSEPVAIATIAAAGFNAVAADKDRDTGIKLVQQRLQPVAGGPGLTIGPECAGVINEFPMYVWASRRDASTKIVRLTDEPIDHHADGLDALRYAVMALGQWQQVQVVTLPSGRRVAGTVSAQAPAAARRSPLERKVPGIRPTKLWIPDRRAA